MWLDIFVVGSAKILKGETFLFGSTPYHQQGPVRKALKE
jgi:hypothetical protein